MMNKETTLASGRAGEDLARRFLEKQGFTIVEMNYHFGRGEIDIIARDGEDLVFCEVKTRWNDNYGDPEYAITQKKQQQLRAIAAGYFFEREIREQACRFDVVAIRMRGGESEIRHIKNAF